MKRSLFALVAALCMATPSLAQNGWTYTGDEDHGLSVEVLSFSPSNVGGISGMKLTFRVWSTWWEKTGESDKEAYYFQNAVLYCSTSSGYCDTGTVTVNEVNGMDTTYADGKDFEMWVGGLANTTAYNWHLLVHLKERTPPDPFFGDPVDYYTEDWSTSPTTTTGTGQTVPAQKQYTMTDGTQISAGGMSDGTFTKVITGTPTITLTHWTMVTIVTDEQTGEWWFTVDSGTGSFNPNGNWACNYSLPYQDVYSVENWSIWNAFSANENPPVEVAMNDAGGFYVDNR